MNLIAKSLFKRIYQKITGVEYKMSYSQTGEDLIVEFLIGAKEIMNFTYLDIGANHPVRLNNTYKFYESGFRGVCIEPDPKVFGYLSKMRPKDICLNIGVKSNEDKNAEFFIMENSLLNTFSREEAEELVRNKQSNILKVITIPIRTVRSIIDQHFNGKSPVFVNLDVEGLDEEILLDFPFDKYRPYIFCIETVRYTENASSEKRKKIFEIMKNQGYMVFADTYVNTIFIEK
jgi:FkbM family methyltransferase